MEKPTLQELVIQKVLEMILDGKVKPGEKLPSMAQLARQMNVSKSIVNLGIQDLARMGFVEIRPRSGLLVADYLKTGSFETIMAIVRYGKLGMNPELQINLVELRNATEGAAILRLARHHSEEDIDALRQQNEALRTAYRKGAGLEVLARENQRFHELICERCGNYVYPLLNHNFGSAADLLWQMCTAYWGAEWNIRENEQTIRDIENGEGQKAVNAMVKMFEDYLEANGMTRKGWES